MPNAQRSPKYAKRFVALAFGAVVAALVAENPFARAIELNVALSFAGVAFGYGSGRPGVFGKRGARLTWWSWLIYWPYFALNFLSLWLFRRTARENPFDEIPPGLWLGCRLWPRDATALPAPSGVLDLTAEFSEVKFLQRAPAYLCIPVLDTTAPTVEDLQRGVEYLHEHIAHGPVYVHCALGHGRSATFAAAYLLSVDAAVSVETALATLKTARSSVDLHDAQRDLLTVYCAELKR